MVKSNISEEIMKTDPYNLYDEDIKSIRENNQKKRLTLCGDGKGRTSARSSLPGSPSTVRRP